jgi:hypothetical protein
MCVYVCMCAYVCAHMSVHKICVFKTVWLYENVSVLVCGYARKDYLQANPVHGIFGIVDHCVILLVT